ncbi:MAG TPA: hypothetical protein VG942_09595 [Hyphomonadaceae bacterium]|nr:hypothetical protein [Hyphomonadaceae bacterium]
MGRFSMRVAAGGALVMVVLGALSPSWAQGDPTQQWIVCYGPQQNGRLDPPKKVYMSGVSTAVRVTGQTAVLITEAFHAFALQKYGADFAPHCDWYATEDQAKRMLNYRVAQPTPPAVATGWVWTQPESDKNPPPPPPPKPGTRNGH